MEVQWRQGPVIAPAGVGEVLDLGFNLARRNYRLLLVTVLWAVVPGYLLSALGGVAAQASSGREVAAPFAAYSLLAALASVLGAALASGAAYVACARLIAPTDDRDELAVGRLYRVVFGALGRVFALGLIIGLASIPLAIIFPLGIYVWTRWTVSWMVALFEGAGPIAALKRSWELTQGSWWHTTGAVTAISVITFFISGSVGGVIAAAARLLGVAVGIPAIGTVLAAVGNMVAAATTTPFSAAIFTVLYFELRARAEGFDLEQRALQAAPSA